MIPRVNPHDEWSRRVHDATTRVAESILAERKVDPGLLEIAMAHLARGPYRPLDVAPLGPAKMHALRELLIPHVPGYRSD